MTRRQWHLVVAAPAARHLDQLPEAAAAAVIETFAAIQENPNRVGRPLRFELEGPWYARRGPYRVIYSIDDKRRTIVVVAIGHRADVYRPRGGT